MHKAWFPAFAAETPYNVIQVELDEGPRLTSNLVGGEKPKIGQRVEVVFDDVDAELTMHRFRLSNIAARPRESGDPVLAKFWIPASAGTSGEMVLYG